MVLSAIGHIARTHPFKFGTVFSCAKTSFSDWLVQTQVEKREHIDWRRNGTFAAFGFFYLGMVQYTLYVPIFSRMFPGAAAYAAAPLRAKLKDVAGTRNMITQVVLDQFVHHPIAYFPVFYCLKEVVNGGTMSGGIEKYKVNYKEDLVALWKLWVPSTIINFSLMPMHMRIPWVASTSLIWTCIISYMRGGNTETDPDQAMKMTGGAQGLSLQGLYDLGISAKPAYLYNKDKEHLLISASGRDRIGFISTISNHVASNSGNILDVKAYKVGREFVTIMLVEIEPTGVSGMKKSLQKVCGGDMQLTFSRTQPWLSDTDSPRCKDGVTYTGLLRATGKDTPGILAKIATLMEEQQLDITSIECKQHSEPGPQVVFQVSGVVRAFCPIDRQELDRRLIAFEGEHATNAIRVGLTETEHDPSFTAFAGSTGTSIATKARGLARTVTNH